MSSSRSGANGCSLQPRADGDVPKKGRGGEVRGEQDLVNLHAVNVAAYGEDGNVRARREGRAWRRGRHDGDVEEEGGALRRIVGV